MARQKNTTPLLKFHKPTGQYCVYLNRQRITLGANEDAAKARHRRFCRDLLEGREPINRPATAIASTGGLTVAEALLRFMRDYAVAYYRDSPKTASRCWEMVEAVRTVAGDMPADAFRGRQLKAVRDWLLSPEKRPSKHGRHRGGQLSRTYVNYLIRRAQQCWKWLLSEDEVSGDCVASLEAVQALHRGRGGRETRRVLPPPTGWDRLLPFLTPTLAAMVRTQEYGGMRPQDVCAMRRCDLSTSPDEMVELPNTGRFTSAFEVDGVSVWVYVPSTHKTAHLDKPRVVPLGPRAQALLAPIVAKLGPTDYVFDPRQSLKEARRGNRFTGNLATHHYDSGRYGQLIVRAIRIANDEMGLWGPPRPPGFIPSWTPNQLRHLQATVVGGRLDREHAQALLGQSAAGDLIDRYMEQAMPKAGRAAAECG